MREFYVYYRVAEDALPVVVAAVRAFQSTLTSRQPGLATGLLRRPEVRDGQVTLMETYAAPGGVDERLQVAIAAGPDGGPSPRHVEAFDRLGEASRTLTAP